MSEPLKWNGHILLCNLPDDSLMPELVYACERVARLIRCLWTPDGYDPEDIFITEFEGKYFVVGNPVLNYQEIYNDVGEFIESVPQYNVTATFVDTPRASIDYETFMIKFSVPRVVIRIPELIVRVPLDRNVDSNVRFLGFLRHGYVQRVSERLLSEEEHTGLRMGEWEDETD